MFLLGRLQLQIVNSYYLSTMLNNGQQGSLIIRFGFLKIRHVPYNRLMSRTIVYIA
jgi:hypothetical protein